jgi:hypothetical protein
MSEQPGKDAADAPKEGGGSQDNNGTPESKGTQDSNGQGVGFPPPVPPSQFGSQSGNGNFGQDPYRQPPVTPYGQSQYSQPGQPPASPYGQPPASPYGQPAASPYGQPPVSPYGQQGYGQPGYYAMPAEPRGMSIASLVCGLASVFLGWFILPQLAAIVLGHLALRREPSGRAMSITGLALGYVCLLGYGLFWIFLTVFAAFAAQYSGGLYP